MADQPAQSSAEQTADIVAMAAAEAAAPGADTENAYECPFCVMMRKGGCEDPFKAFMVCGEKADKGELEMVECLKEFEALNKCMEKNKEMFDGLLTEMKEEEERVKQQDTSSTAEAAAAAPAGGGVTMSHQQAAEQDSRELQQQQQADASSGQPSSAGGAGSSSSSSSSSSAAGHGVPATM